MARARRFTKKQLDPIHKAEIRKVAVLGMGLGATDSWTMTEKEIKDWVYERAEDFSTIDLQGESLGAALETWRPGVANYVSALQKFIRKEGDCPEWKDDLETVLQAVEETFAPEEPVKAAPVKKARAAKIKRAVKKKPEAKAAEEVAQEPVEEVVKEAAAPLQLVAEEATAVSAEPKAPVAEVAELLVAVSRVEAKLEATGNLLSNLVLSLSEAFTESAKAQYTGNCDLAARAQAAVNDFNNQVGGEQSSEE